MDPITSQSALASGGIPRLVPILSLLLLFPASAQTLKISSLAPSGNQLRLTIQNTGPSTSYRLEGSPDMRPGTWVPVTAPFTSRGAQSGYFTIDSPASTTFFYRVVGLSATAGDSDGDGLSNAYETGFLHTNPDLYDTDGDGASDGMEIVYGTDPLDSSSKPVFATKPAVEFENLTGTGTEGQSMAVRIVFNLPYTGPVNYSVVPANTTAGPETYESLAGTVQASGGAASIPIRWKENLTPDPDRILALDLIATGSDLYRVGGRSRHIIRLTDNDAWWNGIVADTYAQRNFRVRLSHDANGLQVTFGAGPVHDGLPLLAGESSNARSSQSEGILPPGTFPGAVQFDSATHFRINTPPIPLPPSGLSLAGTNLTRTLIFESSPANGTFHLIEPARIAGTYTEQLKSLSAPHLNSSSSGTFVIIREAAAPMTLPPP